MGMFDWVHCDYPLPGKPEGLRLSFQTKDLDNQMDTYTITAEGRLLKRCVEWEDTPADELPYKDEPEGSFARLFGCMREKSAEIVDTNYHGDLIFYSEDETADREMPLPWYEYTIRFTQGQVTEVTRTGPLLV